jgi:2-C-methyl-D-erythritol 4-phosphate cytidylyltransferase
VSWALVPAAGSGRRFGGEVPKQYLHAAGKPLIEHALEALLSHPGVEGVVVALGLR